MQSVIQQIEARYRKSAVVDVKSGDTVRVHQEIVEGAKKRVQIFEGMVIRTDRKNSLTSSITIRKVASGIGVEKTYLLHSPSVTKIEVMKRTKVRRNNLSYMRARSGKSARLSAVNFDRDGVNTLPVHEEVVADNTVISEVVAESEAPASDPSEV